MKKLKIGIVGIGRIGKIHIKNISENINDAIIYAAAKVNVKNLPYLNKFGVKKSVFNLEVNRLNNLTIKVLTTGKSSTQVIFLS